MTDATPHLFDALSRGHWVRLRTLIVLRWVAVSGQIAAIEVARARYDLQLDLGLCYFAVGVSIIANLIAVFIYPENKRLSEGETVVTLIFDISQLAFLLYLTGGLNNPFACLVLAPVTIAATALRLQSVLTVAGVAIAMVTTVAFFYVPLRTDLGFVIGLPDLFRFGFWTAIVIGIAFLAVYARRVAVEITTMSEALLATQLALAREQKLTDLGGVVAAAAHELGTPLATIKLVSSELIEELDDRTDLREDAELIRDQADRCRDILRSMGRAGKDDLHMRRAPLDSVIREAAEPHRDRGKEIHFDVAPAPGGTTQQPTIRRAPEIIHGLRNLIQNAVDFAAGQVWVEARWDTHKIAIRIVDDGAGFPTHMLGRIGDPFMRGRRSAAERAQRPEYEGMGLGLFIAKTLLERSGAELSFSNGADAQAVRRHTAERTGAIVEVVWPVTEIRPQGGETSALGENIPIMPG